MLSKAELDPYCRGFCNVLNAKDWVVLDTRRVWLIELNAESRAGRV
jgi:hypothetical protein